MLLMASWQCYLYTVLYMQTLKPCEVPYFLLAMYEKATLSRTTDNPATRISDDVSNIHIFVI